MSRIELGAEGDVLTRDECLHHLASGSVGRVSISSRALPVGPAGAGIAWPVTEILFWADPHDHPAAIADNTVIGFQADHIDAVTHEGWSVMVVGLASHVTGARERRSLGGRPASWLGSGERSARRAVARPRQGPPPLEPRASGGRAMSADPDVALVELGT